MSFSRRATFDLRENRLAQALAKARCAPRPLLDLTGSNPTRCDLPGPARAALAALSGPGVRHYRPEPRGLLEARRAIAGYYAERGVAVDPERLLLTASTSDAYALLFKLLADPGDAILAPVPSYPLFEYLARLDGVDLRPHRLRREGGFHLDLAAIEEGLAGGARAVLVVSPNNPTGNLVTLAELAELDAAATNHGAAVICDEVFADFVFAEAPSPAVAAAAARDALTFSLSGLSKVCGLPQLKLGWIALGGPAERVDEALIRLELIADTYLSVATPVQLAAAPLLAGRHAFQAACRRRLDRNRAVLAAAVAAHPALELLPADGGWTACVRIPELDDEEAVALRLLAEDAVAVHPGYFYDFAAGAHLVVSLLGDEQVFETAVERLAARLG